MAPESRPDVAPIDADIEDAPWTHHVVSPGDVTIHYVEAGPGDGPLVVLLHGFPECWWTWHHQISALADAGYRVVAMDMRGANRSGKPAGAAAYGPTHLAGDVLDLIDDLGHDGARVVGHDFGGLVGWHLGHFHPEAVDRLAILNSPHLSVYGHHLKPLSQLRRSWYVWYFQIPRVPEWGLTRNDYAIFEDIDDGTVDPDAVTEDDEALVPALVDDHHDWVADLRVERFPEAGHWPHFEEREPVTAALLDHC